MKKIILISAVILAVAATARAQDGNCFSATTTIGTGIAMSRPASVPFEWQVLGHYHLNRRFAVGAGTGISVYEKMLIPLFADVKFNITRPRTLTPFLECGAGYSFAPGRNADGGFYLNPSAGLQWTACPKLKLLFAVGYEIQKLARLKKYSNQYLEAEFREQLNHNMASIRVGVVF